MEHKMKSIITAILPLFVFVAVINVMTPQHADARQSEEYNVVLLSLGAEENTFWSTLVDVMESAADDFNINLEVIWGMDDDDQRMENNLTAVMTRSNPPDAVIFTSIRGAGYRLLERTEAQGMPAILINMGLTDQYMNRARSQFQHWIGEITPEEEAAGYLVGQAIIEEAISRNITDDDGNIQIIGLSGRATDIAARERNAGLTNAAAEFSEARLHQIVPTNWSAEDAGRRFQGLYRRYAQTTAVWTASDQMISGLVPVLERSGKTMGEDIIAGSIDWSVQGMQDVQSGLVHANAGGHFMEGAWAIVAIYDYLNGHDFGGDKLIMKSPMELVTSENVDQYLGAINNREWRNFDFGVFSITRNPDVSQYEFDISRILR